MSRTALPLAVVHDRGSAFSYRCHACRRCCYHKRIQLNPFELVHLSRLLGCTTTAVIDRYTTGGGTALASKADGACVFLGEEGCGVHAARPLACRLYPLGRIALDDGREVFIEHAPHSETEGVYGHEGTVADYLGSQDVEPWLQGAERYYAVLRTLMSERRDTVDSGAHGDLAGLPELAEFVDADRAVTARGPGRSVSMTAAELVDAHLSLLVEWAQSLNPSRSRAEGRTPPPRPTGVKL